MNEPNFLENQLRSWTPRRPSDKTAAKLFASDTATEPKRHRFSLNWIAPTTVGLFSLFAILGAHPRSSGHSDSPDTNLFFASITMDNATSFASQHPLKTAFNLSKVDLNLEQNIWRTASFESTNLPQSHSSSRSLPVDNTNSLTR